MLRKHSSFDDFSACVNAGGDYHISLAQIDALYRRVLLWQSTLRKWIGWDGVKTSTSPPRVNLLKVVTDINGEEEVATTVLYQCYLTWEGTLDNAQISAHRVIVDTIAGVLRPFREYVGGLARAMPFVTPQRREVFHWMCFKRLSELFSLESSLKGALPLFSVNTEAFDAFSGARVAQCVEMLPNSDDGADYEPNTEVMDSESTHHTEWPTWFRRLHLELDNLTDKQVVSLKFLQPSLAPDVYVLMRVYYASEQNKLGEKRIPKIDMLVVGLAAINQTTPVSDARIHRECLNFGKIISNLDELTEAADTVTNVLLICATAYTEDLLGDFAGKASVSFNPEAYDCERINEVLALNLAPQAWRKHFFGVGDDELLENSVELIVSRSKEN